MSKLRVGARDRACVPQRPGWKHRVRHVWAVTGTQLVGLPYWHTYSQTRTHAWIKSITSAAPEIDRSLLLFLSGPFYLWVLNTNLFFVFVWGELGAVFAPSFTLHRTATAHKLKMKAAFLRWCATTLCRRRICEEYRVCPRWPLSYKKVCLWQLQASHHWPFYHDEPALKQRPSSSGLLIAEV